MLRAIGDRNCHNTVKLLVHDLHCCKVTQQRARCEADTHWCIGHGSSATQPRHVSAVNALFNLSRSPSVFYCETVPSAERASPRNRTRTPHTTASRSSKTMMTKTASARHGCSRGSCASTIRRSSASCGGVPSATAWCRAVAGTATRGPWPRTRLLTRRECHRLRYWKMSVRRSRRPIVSTIPDSGQAGAKSASWGGCCHAVKR